MVDLYNISFMDNATNPVDLIVGVGTAMGNDYLIGNMILLSFFFVFMIILWRHDFKEMLLINTFVTTIVAIFFAFAEIVAFTTIIYPAVLFFLVLLFHFFS